MTCLWYQFCYFSTNLEIEPIFDIDPLEQLVRLLSRICSTFYTTIFSLCIPLCRCVRWTFNTPRKKFQVMFIRGSITCFYMLKLCVFFLERRSDTLCTRLNFIQTHITSRQDLIEENLLDVRFLHSIKKEAKWEKKEKRWKLVHKIVKWKKKPSWWMCEHLVKEISCKFMQQWWNYTPFYRC